MASTTVKGTLAHGLQLEQGGEVHKDFEIREATTADLFDAEEQAPVSRQLAYQGALLGQQIVRLGGLQGPIELAVIRKLHPKDFDMLVEAQAEADREGKGESAA